MNVKKSTVIKVFKTKTNLKIFSIFVFCKKELITEPLRVEHMQLGMQYMRRMRDRNHPLHHLFSTRLCIDYRISLSSHCNITRSEFSKLLQEICNKLLHYYMFYNYNTRH